MREKDGDTPDSGSKMSSGLTNVQVCIGSSVGSRAADVGLRWAQGDDTIGQARLVRR